MIATKESAGCKPRILKTCSNFWDEVGDAEAGGAAKRWSRSKGGWCGEWGRKWPGLQ